MSSDLKARLSLPATQSAPLLLGCKLRVESHEGPAEVALIELEAYMGTEDPASHAFGGPTDRNRSMFGAPGTLYVYRAYGVHWCANVATGSEGNGQAVLFRAGIPTEGEELMRARRRRTDHLADGPGRLTQALGLTRAHDGLDVLGSGPVLLLSGPSPRSIQQTPRVGISVARDRLWRFALGPTDSPTG